MATPIPQELTDQISFIEVVPPFSVLGKTGTEEAVFATVWARIREEGGDIAPDNQQHLIQRQQFEVWTQYNAGITGFMEIKWGTRRLTILSAPQKVIDRFGRYWTTLVASEATERTL